MNTSIAMRLLGLVAVSILALTGLGCPDDNNSCSGYVNKCDVEGELRCLDDANMETCTNYDGCLAWDAAACGAGMECDPDLGSCQLICVNECNQAFYPACSEDGLAVESCEVGADGCNDIATSACGAGEVCDPDTVACVCTDDCDPANFPVCNGDLTAAESCVEQADGCFDLIVTDCGANAVCDEATAACVDTCVDECVAADHPACSASGFAVETCVDGADGCTDLVTTDCAMGDVCDAGTATCVAAGCTDDCVPADYPACAGDMLGIDTCERQADGCYDMVLVGCGVDEICDDSGADPICAAGCLNECDAADYPMCSGDSRQALDCVDQADGCTDIVAVDCGMGETCDPATFVCVVSGCTDDCDPANFPACSADFLAIESCDMAADGCYDLGTTGCGMDEICDDAGAAPACITGCLDDCLIADYPACAADLLAVETCVQQADGCNDIVSTDCAAAEECDVATFTCESTCTDDCALADYPACSADLLAVETCVQQADGCNDIVSTDCAAAEECDVATFTCESTCADDCALADYPACAADLSAVETCELQADGCNDIVSTDCTAFEECDAATFTCELTCTDDCDPADYPACSGDLAAVETCEMQADGCNDIISTGCAALEACDPATLTCESTCAAVVADGSFEVGSPSTDWVEASTNFGTPICDNANCGDAQGTSFPLSGTFFVWFGGVDAVEVGSVSQSVSIPLGATATLQFYLHMPSSSDDATDVFEVTVDGDVLFTLNATESANYAAYTMVEVDLSAYNDGWPHDLVFISTTNGVGAGGTLTNLLLDDVSLLACNGTCVHECLNVDDLACSADLAEILICQVGAETCNEWTQDTDCAGNNETCNDSGAAPVCEACTDECTLDELQCNGSDLETCVTGADTCTDWQFTEDCTATGYCDDSVDPAVCAPFGTTVPGDDCADANIVPLSVPADLPGADLSQTTCGRVDDYSDTCMGSYDGDEDIIYQLDVSAPTLVNIIIDPKGTAWTGVGVGPTCPLGLDDCLIGGGSSGSAPYMTGCLSMDVGTYTVMVDIYPDPDYCIPEFDIFFEACECLTGETQCADAGTVAVCDAMGMWQSSACADGCAELEMGTFGCYVTPAAAGDLIITEIIQNPAAVLDADGEWFEIYNNTGDYANLLGLVFQDDGGDTFTVDSDVVMAAGTYAVLGLNADIATNGGVNVDFEYAGTSLANGSDEIEIFNGAVSIDRVAWDNGATWPDPTGASMALDPASLDATANDDGANWCTAQLAYGDGDLGTPGSLNLDCAISLIHLVIDFETDLGWTLGTDWAWGVTDPAYASGPAACAAGQCLGTVLDASYNSDSAFDINYAELAPIDLSTAGAATMLQFDMWLNMETNYDAAQLLVSTDGAVWTVLDPTSPAYNYNDPVDSWTGDVTSGAWMPVSVSLAGLEGGDVYIRFAIESDGSVNRAGMYVDNVLVYE